MTTKAGKEVHYQKQKREQKEEWGEEKSRSPQEFVRAKQKSRNSLETQEKSTGTSTAKAISPSHSRIRSAPEQYQSLTLKIDSNSELSPPSTHSTPDLSSTPRLLSASICSLISPPQTTEDLLTAMEHARRKSLRLNIRRTRKSSSRTPSSLSSSESLSPLMSGVRLFHDSIPTNKFTWSRAQRSFTYTAGCPVDLGSDAPYRLHERNFKSALSSLSSCRSNRAGRSRSAQIAPIGPPSSPSEFGPSTSSLYFEPTTASHILTSIRQIQDKKHLEDLDDISEISADSDATTPTTPNDKAFDDFSHSKVPDPFLSQVSPSKLLRDRLAQALRDRMIKYKNSPDHPNVL